VLFDSKFNAIKIAGTIVSGSTFSNLKVGIWLRKDGSLTIGTN
jgi:hypothetical protein